VAAAVGGIDGAINRYSNTANKNGRVTTIDVNGTRTETALVLTSRESYAPAKPPAADNVAVKKRRGENFGDWVDADGFEPRDKVMAAEKDLKMEFQYTDELRCDKTRPGIEKRFTCSIPGCGFRARVRKSNVDEKWRPQLRAGFPIHVHVGDEETLPYSVLQEVVAVLNDSTQWVQPKALYRDLCRRFPNERCLRCDAGKRAELVVRNMVKNFRRRQNGNPIGYMFRFVHWKNSIALVVPRGYQARCDYVHADELAASMGVQSSDRMFLLPPTEDVLQSLRSMERGLKTIADTVVLTSAAELFNLQCMIRNIPKEQWSLDADGTKMITFDGRVVIPFGTGDYGWRLLQNE